MTADAAGTRTSGASSEAPVRRRKRRQKKAVQGDRQAATSLMSSTPFDLTFLIIVLILLVMGIIMMFSAGYAWAIFEGQDGTYYVKRQCMMAGIGIVGMAVASKIDYHRYRNGWFALGVFGFAVLLCLLLLTPLGQTHGGATRWLKIPKVTEFQPSEIMKLAIIVLFAYLISVNYSRMKTIKYGIIPYFLFLGLVAGLMMLQPHLSGTILICAIGLSMVFVGGAKINHIVIIGIIGVAALVGVVFLLIELKGIDYFETRINIWLDPFSDPTGDSWQTQNSLIAIGSGGIFGLGLGNSRQKFLYLPESKNDFVFAVVCEELGLVGALMVIILFALFIFRGFYIASKSPDKFGMMLVVGITIQIGLQALLNIAVVTNTIPNTGISLPFFSYGGTALIMQLVEMGLILNVSRQSVVKE